MGISETVSRTLGPRELPLAIAGPLALLASGAVATLLLAVLMQSQMKGQVLMACYVSFSVSTLLVLL